MPRLTEARQLETRNTILDAALRLFTERGFDDTTVSQIAEAAGVSRRTVYRYFPKKDDLIFEFPRRWFDMFDSAVADRESGQSLRDLVRNAYRKIAESIADDAQRVLTAFAVLNENEALRGRHGVTDDLNAARLVGLMMAEPGASTDQLLDYLVIARCMISANNAALTTWALGFPNSDVVVELGKAHDMLDNLWPPIFVD